MDSADVLNSALPRRLQVEVTAACNLRCRMCIVRYRPALGRAASMSFATFKQLVDGLPELQDVTLQGIGEPLMAPDIYQMVAYAAERGIRCGFNTNATLLTRAAGERLLAAGIDWLCFSLDGATKETYEFVRDQSNWETVNRNIERFLRLARARGTPEPELTLVMVLMRRNLHELPAVVEQAAAWGIPTVFAQSLSHDFSDAPPAAYASIAEYVNGETIAGLPAEQVQAVYEQARTVAQRHGVALRLPNLEEHADGPEVQGTRVACSWPWDAGYVSYDGTVLPCCMVMGNDRVALGNVHDRSYTEIWSNDDFRRFRAGLVNGTPHAVCRGCSMYRGLF